MSWPKNWTRTTLGDVAEVLSGFAFKSKDFNTDGKGMPLVRIRDVVSGATSTFFSGDFDPRFIVRCGDILVGMDGDFNRSRWASEEALLNQRVCKVSAAEGLDDGYLFHLLPQILQVISDRTPFVTVKHLSAKELKEYEIPLPPLEEQKRIAGILDQAAELCRLRTRALDKLGILGQAIFHEMFGDLSINSEGWETKPIGEVCEAMVDCVNRTAPVVEGQTPWRMIRTTNIRHGVVNLDTVRYVDEQTFERWNRRLTPRPGDVLLTREAPVGEVGVLRETGVFLGQRLFLYRPDADILLPEFLSYQMMSPYFELQFSQSGSGSTVKHLPLPACQSFEVRVPPVEKQSAFDAAISALTAEELRLRRCAEHAQTLFSSLQHRAFRGKL
ncbi:MULTISPECIES: restriction endonuclease subunit S [Gluconobacter]|uniref:Type I restriction modification DNA specificity domain-containing protein n=1 Tax=Gluconobacter cadivus TaxID=2728101 RepID=A0ABR9YYX1_9PROT|nr:MULTISPECIES: restriction endonuclease subunit S [Gluconobacter]MBF0889733.1 hypothetical protein [Gluconobacter cadivus]MBS1061319.1 restriction endonuclease subunit S [Gluconobacter sp. Dm-44]